MDPLNPQILFCNALEEEIKSNLQTFMYFVVGISDVLYINLSKPQCIENYFVKILGKNFKSNYKSLDAKFDVPYTNDI